MLENKSVMEILLQRTGHCEDVWVFGYGSLTWNPDFPYEDNQVGYIKGYVRRFWQGSTWHRGNQQTPGRVVTLVEETEGQVWGIAFKINKRHIDKAFGTLTQREVTYGGYELHHKTFYPHRPSTTETTSVFLYVAIPTNTLFLGQEPNDILAQQIVRAHGKCGPNVEYLFRLVDFMREKVPGAHDEHLFHIAQLVRIKLGLPVNQVSSWNDIAQGNHGIFNTDLQS